MKDRKRKDIQKIKDKVKGMKDCTTKSLILEDIKKKERKEVLK